MPALTISKGLLAKLGAALRGRGVLGAFYGQRLEGDLWSEELGISYHSVKAVYAVAPLRLPRPGKTKSTRNDFPELEGLRATALQEPSLTGKDAPLAIEPRVQVVGDVGLHRLSYGDLAGRIGSLGTITAMVPDDEGGTLALLSGHASLPQDANGKLITILSENEAPGLVVAEARDGAVHGQGEVVRGKVGNMSSQDWGLARFPGEADLHHPRLGRAPFPMRVTEIVGGEEMWVMSSLRDGGPRLGYARQVGVLDLPHHGERITYQGVYAIYPDENSAFSVHGDSGALVYDRYGLAWGVIIGGPDSDAAPRTTPSYALPLAALPREMRRTFFTRTRGART